MRRNKAQLPSHWIRKETKLLETWCVGSYALTPTLLGKINCFGHSARGLDPRWGTWLIHLYNISNVYREILYISILFQKYIKTVSKELPKILEERKQVATTFPRYPKKKKKQCLFFFFLGLWRV